MELNDDSKTHGDFCQSYHSVIVLRMDFANTVNKLAMHKANAFVPQSLEVLQSETNALTTIALIAVSHSDIRNIQHD